MALHPVQYGLIRGRTEDEPDFYGFTGQLDRVERVDKLPSAQAALHEYLKRTRDRSKHVQKIVVPEEAAVGSEVELVPLTGNVAAPPESCSRSHGRESF